MLVEAKYMPPDREKDVLTRKFPSLPEDLLTKMVDYANHVRSMFIGATEQDTHIADISTVDLNNDKFKTMQMPLTFSTRTLLRWAYLANMYAPLKNKGVNIIKYSLDRSIGYRADPATRIALHELAQSIFGYKE